MLTLIFTVGTDDSLDHVNLNRLDNGDPLIQVTA
jgi:hypothetical protein